MTLVNIGPGIEVDPRCLGHAEVTGRVAKARESAEEHRGMSAGEMREMLAGVVDAYRSYLEDLRRGTGPGMPVDIARDLS